MGVVKIQLQAVRTLVSTCQTKLRAVVTAFEWTLANMASTK